MNILKNYGDLYRNGICPSVIIGPITTTESIYTARELEVIKLMAEGLTAGEIAQRLYISILTVRTHRKNILFKCPYKNATELVVKCVRQGLI